jgi:hypothetical protein
MMFTVNSNFIGNFKIGDNINSNLDTLNFLYEIYSQSDQNKKGLLRKPIILILTGITEAILYDFYHRIKLFTLEGVKNLTTQAIAAARDGRYDDFGKCIALARANNLFKLKSNDFYNELDELRKLRNRVHIQNKHGELEGDEFNAFTEARKIKAEKALERLAKIMASKHPRENMDFVRHFEFPWNTHFR